MLAKFIRMRTARSHPRGARTRALNVPRRASTNIGNRAKNKSIKARQRSAATIRFFCFTFFFVKKSKWSQLSDDACGEPERSDGTIIKRAGAKRRHDYKASRSEATAIACNLMACHWVAKRKENRKNRNPLQIFTGLIFLQAKKWSQLSESNR